MNSETPPPLPVTETPIDEKQEEVLRRAELMLASGRTPEFLCVCWSPDGVCTFHPQTEARPVLLFFTTPHAAQDYIRASELTAQVKYLPFEALERVGAGYVAAGVERFAINKCPRCAVALTYSINALQDQSDFLKVWAISQATQQLQAELQVREFIALASTSLPAARAALEMLRDHIDCSVPYVHELIAFFARGENDEAAVAASLERLLEFGPQFADWETRWNPPEGGLKALGEATVGLVASYGIELKSAAVN